MIFIAVVSTLLQGDLVRSFDPQNFGSDYNKAHRVSEIKCMEYSQPLHIYDEPSSTNEPSTTNEPTTTEPLEVSNIAGGVSAYTREFPHMAAIGWLNADGSHTFDCGGALVSSSFVLTAAHCTYSHGVDNPVPHVVRLGDRNIDNYVNDGAAPVQIAIKTIHKHPAYTRKKYYNDIALLELSTAVTYSYDIQPICVWTKELDELEWAVATGWGVTNPETNEKANNLQKVRLSILNNEVCFNLLKNNINRKWDQGIITSQLCASEPKGGKDTCQGDFGSPLQIISKKYPYNYYVIGITSFGPRTCARLPAIYTKVTSYLDWIESVVWPDDYRNWTLINGKINNKT